jgi:hypothetical protein
MWLGSLFCVPEVMGSNPGRLVHEYFFGAPWRSKLELLSLVPWATLLAEGVPFC